MLCLVVATDIAFFLCISPKDPCYNFELASVI
jgi:hypothetical protein